MVKPLSLKIFDWLVDLIFKFDFHFFAFRRNLLVSHPVFVIGERSPIIGAASDAWGVLIDFLRLDGRRRSENRMMTIDFLTVYFQSLEGLCKSDHHSQLWGKIITFWCNPRRSTQLATLELVCAKIRQISLNFVVSSSDLWNFKHFRVNYTVERHHDHL